MRAWRFGCGLVLAVTALVPIFAQNLESDLQRAIQAQVASGDCRAAIEAYRKIIAQAGTTNRAVAAQALVQIAECQRKLGEDEAKRTYEEVLAKYADQRDAIAVARGRIAPGSPGLSNRMVWDVPEGSFFWGHVSTDGRSIAFGKEDGNIYVHDLRTDSDRRVTHTARAGTPPDRGEGYGDDFYTFSRDGKQLAYSWRVGNREELRVVGVAGPAPQTPKVLLKDADIQYVTPFDWSPDGTSIAVGIWRFNRSDSELVLMSVTDGSTRHLRSIPENSGDAIGHSVFSPDGRHLAYNPDRQGGNSNREIVVIDLATTRERSIMQTPRNDKIMGWAPDGGIVFVSNRTGSDAVWHVPVKEGVPGEARPLDVAAFGYDNARMWRMGMTSAGSFYYRMFPPSLTDVQIAALDYASGHIELPPVNATSDFVGSNSQPVLSNDGRYLAFQSSRPGPGIVIVIRSMETGEARELRPNLTTVSNLVWSTDGTALAASGSAGERAPLGVYRIDAKTGETAAFFPSASAAAFRQWSPDGRRVYFDRWGSSPEDTSVIERDLASGTEREIHRGVGRGLNRLVLSPDGGRLYYRHPVRQGSPQDLIAKDVSTGTETVLVRQRQIGGLFLSPDGRFIVTRAPDPTTNVPTLLLVSTDGSLLKELVRDFNIVTWSPDSQSIIASPAGVGVQSTGARLNYWWIPVDGRGPRQLDLPDTGRVPSGLVSTGGKWLAFAEREPGYGGLPDEQSQIWVLENFLPRPVGGRGAGGSIR